MTEKSFTNALRRGLESAIVELKNNENRMQYRDIVLRYCLRDIAHDTHALGLLKKNYRKTDDVII